jgi:Fe2+ transport system protein FeoA
MPSDDSIPLSSLRPNQIATIQSVKAANTDLLRYLTGLGLIPGVRIEVMNFSPFDHNLTIKVRYKLCVLGLNITNKIYVRPW